MKPNAALVVMAAGMGSRFGGLKQIEPVGPNGEIILDYSIYDAVKAGFDKVVFVIRRDIEKDFRNITKTKIENLVDVEYVFQDMDNLPAGFSVPDGRTKPWGTGHAVYCVSEVVDIPFGLINADDYYGQSSYGILYDSLTQNDNMCMVGFKLKNTLTENGTVARGVCNVQNHSLISITEHTALDQNCGLDPDTVVSMNMWGFKPGIFEYIHSDFVRFLGNLNNPMKDEFYIPYVVDNMIHNRGIAVDVLESMEKWYGVTYKSDKPLVEQALKKLTCEGYYDGI